MAEENSAPPGPDLEKGIALAELADGGMLVGHVGESAVLLESYQGRGERCDYDRLAHRGLEPI